MKTAFWFSCLIVLTPACASAQVTVNPAALRQLEGLSPAAPVPEAQQAVAKPPVHVAPAHRMQRATPMLPKPPPAPPPPPGKPESATPPAPAAPLGKAPVVTAPLHKPAAPKPAIPALAKLEFAPGSAALPAGAAATLKPFCGASGQVPVIAHAPADPSDPSSAMRLSLARAFAIRDALTACGLPPQNIIPRAAGHASGADDNAALIGAGAKP